MHLKSCAYRCSSESVYCIPSNESTEKGASRKDAKRKGEYVLVLRRKYRGGGGGRRKWRKEEGEEKEGE